jgi:hypothetical protein
MSMIFKVAYARGVQHALVQAGAIRKYANEALADAAAAEAATEMPDAVQPEEAPVPESVTSDVAAKLVELSQAAGETAVAAANQSNLAQEAAQAVHALQEGVPAADPAALGMAAQELEQKAAAFRHLQKRAYYRKLAESDLTGAAVGMPTGIDGLAADLTAEGAIEAAKRPGDYANMAPAMQMDPSVLVGAEMPHPGAPTMADAFSSFSGPGKSASVNLSTRTAARLLRKLAESDIGATGGGTGLVNTIDGISGVTEEGDMEGDKRPSGYAADSTPNIDTDPAAQIGAETKVAFEYLFRKTAAEVGRYMPRNIPSRTKVAAIRTMMGMNNNERASYLRRLYKAAEEAAAVAEEEDNMDEAEGSMESTESEDAEDGEESEESPKEEEKSAAAILRRLGLGR